MDNRIFSVIFYITLRLCGLSFRLTTEVLNKLNLLNVKTCHTWVKTIVDEDDVYIILKEDRGSYKAISFYEVYPELEIEAKVYALENARKKTSSFKVENLAKFIDDFTFITGKHSRKTKTMVSFAQ